MQQALDIFESYCEIWRLQVNVAKTKVMIFRKRKTAQDPKFILHDPVPFIIQSIKYSLIINKGIIVLIPYIVYFKYIISQK
jgi:hypothetical protein